MNEMVGNVGELRQAIEPFAAEAVIAVRTPEGHVVPLGAVEYTLNDDGEAVIVIAPDYKFGSDLKALIERMERTGE